MNIKQTISNDELRVKIFKALADESRLAIVRLLHGVGHEMDSTSIGEQLGISKSTLSYHLKLLREAGLTTTRRAAQTRYVGINSQVFTAVLPGFLGTL
ncbi:ArsR/SmtB family transcription factor [Lacticaseibacillus pantheris]|uniref:HTH arsR-type domain-containing protein n=1 Tax=Lacticaseibacillus pantheris DSM 15945 = JCM 12539 = NBRC 106106 TaxID=1423783 RepID=A0A0R1U2L1_9LACO|nr:metalloregulator ArsR/SmtB family transcription factor [Lacticaseibacillus pantheris]KRL85464.1 hypothetical protein FC50_GL001629 [Lacticaseibacillus pantheris DSM 15945 = JCM 12539 = NBRC 106106]WKF85510.1 metalloregulator ArsR/SmtB family transcription factor [Lacticaseibacillus pantheris]